MIAHPVIATSLLVDILNTIIQTTRVQSSTSMLICRTICITAIKMTSVPRHGKKPLHHNRKTHGDGSKMRGFCTLLIPRIFYRGLGFIVPGWLIILPLLFGGLVSTSVCGWPQLGMPDPAYAVTARYSCQGFAVQTPRNRKSTYKISEATARCAFCKS